MAFIDTFQAYLASPELEPLLPFLWAGLGFVSCFFIMGFIVARYKKRYRELQAEHARLTDRIELENQLRQEQQQVMEQAGEDMRLQFRDLAQEIFEEKSTGLTRRNSESLDFLLKPYREQLASFRERLETIFLEESRDHSSLKQELLNLRELNQRINDEAAHLARTISGDNKLQGTWGEMVLERLLEQSGLREGHEYVTQAGFRDDMNRLFKPDVIVHLPEQRDIVIDSKVSLVGWSRYTGAETDKQRDDALKEHIRSIRTHLKSLGQKDYSSLGGIRSLDFVLMFIPIDQAFGAAVEQEEKLVGEMYRKKVLIVTPTTLMATLKIIATFWRSEHQSRNAVEIAERAGSLYDKLRGFMKDMEKLGAQLDSCKDSYDKAINKLSNGRGNLVSQAARFPELGVKVKEEFDTHMNNTKE